ncbi:MAG TPA: M1 family aminopeptidase [Fimbriimonadaceae bacterium]|nr:M1 family aminopeptidase [Fimbriimonadaceae bacterium]
MAIILRSSLVLSSLCVAASLWAGTGSTLCGHAHRWSAAVKHGFSPTMTKLGAPETFTDTDVLHQVLNITLSPPATLVNGDNTLTVKSLRAGLTEFTFRLGSNFTITACRLDGRDITFTRLNTTTVRANFDRPYALDEQFTLFIDYEGNATSSGFGSIEFGTQGGAPYVFTLSEPWYSYTWWPNKDDNNDKSTYALNVTVPSTLKVAANGLLQGTDNLGGGLLRYRWLTNYAMSPYLLSIGATNFNKWTQNYNYAGGSMPVEFYIWPSSDTTANRTAWEKCLQMLPVFEAKFGQYPFIAEKYGMYQFTFGGGMEHQTMTGMGGFWESVNAHELAHQWWGDMITCGTWHDIWLNEGFATYSEALWSELKPGSSGLAALKSAMSGRRPSGVGGTVYCYDISDPNRIFSGTYSYNKAAWALHMLRGVVGDTTFFNILTNYRSQFQYKTAITDDLVSVANATHGSSLNWFFDQWVYGGGAPAYQWAWSTATSNGKHYLLVYVRQTQTAYPVFKMPIDIRPTVGGVKQAKEVWNDAATENFVIPLTGTATACTFDEDTWILATSVNSTTFAHGGPTIVETVPAAGSTSASRINQVKVTFHTGVNASALDFAVKGGAVDAQIPFTYSYSGATNTVTLNFPKGLRKGNYTLIVKDSVRATNTNLQLDGEMTGTTLPSGNGQPGGMATIPFSCTAP